MVEMKKMMVCLDRSDWDAHVIRYASMMAGLVNCSHVVFSHAAKANLDSSLKKELEEKVADEFTNSCAQEVIIVEGTNASDVLGWPEISTVDLIVMGIKPKSISSGQHAAKVIHGSLCSTLLVPVNSKNEISKILLPMDFTNNSLRSLKLVQGLKEESNIEIVAQHVYFVPIGYSSTGKTYHEFAAIMEQNKKKEYEQFKKKNGIVENGYKIIFSLDEDRRPSDKIYALAKEVNVDFLVLGSTAKSKAASLLLFSTSIGLLKYDEDVPCLIVKDKNESMGFFDALLKI